MKPQQEFEVEIEKSEVPDHFYGKLRLEDGKEVHFTYIIDPIDTEKGPVPKIIWHLDNIQLIKFGLSKSEAESIILKEINQ